MIKIRIDKKRYSFLLFFTGLIIFIIGCTVREPLLERALIPIDLAPQILSISPEENLSNVPVNARIYIEFPDSMDIQSVEDNTYLKYGDTILDKNNLSFIWDSTKTLLIIDPVIDLPPDTEITVVIETGAINQLGIHLPETFTCSFTTSSSAEPDTTPPNIVSFYPSSYQVTNTGVEVQLTFSEEMSHISVEKSFILTDIDNQEIYTYTNGSFSWHGTTMIYTPNNTLSMNKEYIISFSSTDFAPQDLAGNTLTGTTTSRFYTLDSIIYVSQASGDDNNPGYHITLPVKTINKGIQRAVTYGYNIVKIEEGTYYETINLGSQESGITIEGGYVTGNNFNTRDINNKPTIIQSNSDSFSVIISGGSNIRLDGVFIKGGTYSSTENGGINITNSSDITLQQSTIYGTESNITTGIGLECQDSTSVSILDSTIYGAYSSSVTLTGDIYGIKASSSTLSAYNSSISVLEAGASATGKSYGAYIDNASSTSARLTIQNSSINQGGLGGDGESYGIYGDGATIDITSSSIYGGDSSGNTSGIFILNSPGINISDNTDIRSGDSTGSSAISYGIYISSSSNITVDGNLQIEGNSSGSPDTSFGIYITGSNNGTISGNTISGGSATTSVTGIYVNGSSTSITISNNSITGGSSQTSYGVYIDNSTVTIKKNSTINGGSGTNTNYGIFLSGADNSTIEDNTSIEGGGGTIENYGIAISGTGQCTVTQNQNIKGGTAGTIYGIWISSSSPTIEYNSTISAGSTNSGNSYGIYIENLSLPTIKDNQFITGGTSDQGDTFGISVISNSAPSIYRNTILGGEESSGGIGSGNYGIYYINASTCILENNFIIGSTQSTDPNNNTYGIYIDNSEVKILNNTIDGGNNSSSINNSYGIYALKNGSSSWSITPIIINNILIGGNSSTSYGIYFDFDTSAYEIPCVIFNNVYNDEKSLHFVSTQTVDINSTNTLNGSVGSVTFDPDPKSNIEYSNDSDITFIDKSNYDYHIDILNSNSLTITEISTNGFNDTSDPNYNVNTIYTPTEAALYDIDEEPRPTSDYSNIDLGADEFN